MNTTKIARTTMRSMAAIFVVTVGLRAADTAKATSPVEVTFVSPEKFTDVTDRFAGDSRRDELLSRLKEHLAKNAAARLAPGQKLAVTFMDIDLAGDFEEWRGIYSTDIRILREIYPPRMKLKFSLTDAAGKVVKEGARELIDGAYLWNKAGFPDDELRFDKKLLDDWLRAEFPRARS